MLKCLSPFKQITVGLLIFFTLCLSSAWCSTLSALDRQLLSQALQADDADSQLQLKAGEKQVLLAALALQQQKPETTLLIIEKADKQDPLVAVITAEAHRQLAIRAVARAGNYGQTLQQQRERLQAIDLSRGLSEADVRLQAIARSLRKEHGVPLDVLQLGTSVNNILLVDKQQARLMIYHMDAQGELHLDADEYAVTGTNKGDKKIKGDKRTPNGVYRIIQRLDDPALRARYGPLAFPLDYPNELDRLHGKSGSGIWLHGYQQSVLRRPPQDTLGCVALPNDRLLDVAPCIRLHHSWIVIGERIALGDHEQRIAMRDDVLQTLQLWAKDWSSRDHQRYIGHYDQAFRSGKYDYAQWDRYKKRVNGRKSSINVSLSDITLVHDPHRWPEGEVVVAEFEQHYQSSNLNSQSRKRLYLVRKAADQPWRILIEVSVKRP